MFLRYSRCIWKMPCAPHCKQQGPRTLRRQPRRGTEGYPASYKRRSPSTRHPPCIPEKHAGFDSII